MSPMVAVFRSLQEPGEKAYGAFYISPVKPILLVHDYEWLRISLIFGNTPPPYFQIFSSADSLA
jgi:hypothetical protein